MGEIIIDKNISNIDHSNSLGNRLTIVINPDYLEFCISKDGKIEKIDSISFDSEGVNVAEKLELVKKESPIDSKTHILLNNPDYTFVPYELYDKNDQRAYLRNVIDLDILDKIVLQKDDLQEQKMMCLYTFSDKISNEIQSVFPNAVITHQNSNIKDLVLPNREKYVYACVKEASTNLIAFNKSNVLLSNTYQTQNKEELLYYLLLLYDQLNLDVNEVPTFVTGPIEKNSGTMTLLQDYIQSVELLAIPDEVLSTPLDGKDTHKYYDLYISSLCEL